MNTYRNPYFEFEIQLPASWRLLYWGNSKTPTKFPERNQISYDDLPNVNEEAKSLFLSYCREKGSSSLHRNFIGIEAVYRKGEYDVALEYPVFEEQTRRVKGEIQVGSVIANSLYIETNVTNNDFWSNYMNIIYWRVSETIWLRGNVQGNSKSCYKESLEIFSRYRRLSL